MPNTDLITVPKKHDGRLKKRTKLDVGEVIKLRDVKGLTFGEISKVLGYDKGYIHKAYHEFHNLLKDANISKSYEENRTRILSSLELRLLQNLADADKLKKASTNNIAYAFDKVFNSRRLEEGKSTSGNVINIEIVYQEAADRARQTRLKHAGSGISETLETVSSNDQGDDAA